MLNTLLWLIPVVFVDYLICDQSLTPLVAIRCGAAADSAAFAAACVAAAGVRWVEISPPAPITRDAMRALCWAPERPAALCISNACRPW